MILSLAILTLLLIAFILTYAFSIPLGVVPMPSSTRERLTVERLLEDVDAQQVITDLGSGWGGMAMRLSDRFPERDICAMEYSPIPYMASKIMVFLTGRANIKVQRRDIYSLPLESNRCYVTYLSGPAMKKLRKSFERDRPTGGLLISIAFAMPGWTPVKEIQAGELLHSPVYLYKY